MVVDVIESAAIELVAQLFAPDAESVSARVLAQHQFRIGHSHRLWRHDFVGQGILQNAVLMNAGFVGKCIATDNRLIRLHRHTR